MTGSTPGRKFPMLTFEKEAIENGFARVAGVDEAGRGPLAGPVVASAVVLPAGFDGDGLTDSKALSEKKRELWFDKIMNGAEVGIGIVSHETIDEINILQAARLAMRLAALQLAPLPDMLLIDGNQPIEWNGRQKTIVKGDSLSLSISAGSVIAKVTRDRMMKTYALEYPGYGFEKHKGYPSRYHKEQIALIGPSPIHRKSFRGVKEHCH